MNDDDDGEKGVLQRGGEAQPEAKNMDFRCGNRLPEAKKRLFRCGNRHSGAKNLLFRCGNRSAEAKSLLFRCGEAPPEAKNSDLRHGNRDSSNRGTLNSYNFEKNFSIILSEATTKTSGRSSTSKLQENYFRKF